MWVTLEGRVILPDTGSARHVERIQHGARLGVAPRWYDQPRKQGSLLVGLEVEVADPTPATHQRSRRRCGGSALWRWPQTSRVTRPSFLAHRCDPRQITMLDRGRACSTQALGRRHDAWSCSPGERDGRERRARVTGERDGCSSATTASVGRSWTPPRTASSAGTTGPTAASGGSAHMASGRARSSAAPTGRLPNGPSRNGRACPRCGHTAEDNRPHKGLLFSCEVRQLVLHADLIGARIWP